VIVSIQRGVGHVHASISSDCLIGAENNDQLSAESLRTSQKDNRTDRLKHRFQ